MRNKRLLAILIIFVIVVTAAILGSVVFTVKHIEINFVNDLNALKDVRTEIEDEIRTALPFVMGNNIFLSVNEERIKKTIHDDPNLVLVNFRNVEAHFPNKLVIRVRERYPVYEYKQDGSDNIAIMDGELRIISNTRPNQPLISLNNQIETEPVDGHYLKRGNYLTDYLPRDTDNNSDTTRTNIIKTIVPYFQINYKNNEDAIPELFNAIKFTKVYSKETDKNELAVLLRQPPQAGGVDNFFMVCIERADRRFSDKLTRAWQGIAEMGSETPGTHYVFECDPTQPGHTDHQGICWNFSPTVANTLWDTATN